MLPLTTISPIVPLALSDVAGGLTIAVMVVGAIVFLFTGLRISQEGGKEVKKRAYRIRKFWFLGLLVVALVTSGVVLGGNLPYTETGTTKVASGVTQVSQSDATNPVVVDVTGRQWAWQIEKRELPADRPLEFRVTSADVNHGFAIYRDSTLIAQVQAMPGYTNVLILKFDRPGEYQIRCLEYCGAGHTAMRDQITIVEQGA
jgi:cytochrome c oxidase subunit 2